MVVASTPPGPTVTTTVGDEHQSPQSDTTQHLKDSPPVHPVPDLVYNNPPVPLPPSNTVDMRHAKKMTSIRELQSSIPDLVDALERTRKELHALRAAASSVGTTTTDPVLPDAMDVSSVDQLKWDIEQKTLELASRVEAYEQHVKEVHEEELRYIGDTATILYKYYDIIDNGGTRPTGARICAPNTKSPGSGKSILNLLFKHDDSRNTGERDGGPNVSTSVSSDDMPRCDEFDGTAPDQKIRIVDSYMHVTDDTHVREYMNDGTFIGNKDRETEQRVCTACQYDGCVMVINEGVMLCPKCNRIETLLADFDRPSYKEPPKEVSYFSYRRSNHFQEWLSQVQGRETTDIPDEVFDRIMVELKKQRITNLADLKHSKLKSILKKERLSQFYEHVPHILNRLSGRTMCMLTPDMEEQLRNMFMMVQTPFLKHSPPDRRNFLSYGYVLHKFIQLKGWDEYLGSFPLLKSREKLHMQDIIWKRICDDLGWQFIKSI